MEFIANIDPLALVFFTDGSLIGGKAGAGWVLLINDIIIDSEAVPLGIVCTVFQAELHAINLVCSYCLKNNLVNKSIFICSDSKAALAAVMKYNITKEDHRRPDSFSRFLTVIGHVTNGFSGIFVHVELNLFSS